VLNQLTLEGHQRDIFHVRYIPLLRSYEARALLFAIIFHVSRTIVTVGSITVPALLSLQDVDKWLTWSISLAVSICNGILTLFKIDKKYYSLHTTWHVLESEGWQYIALSGKYSHLKNEPQQQPTHKNQFSNFCLAIEKIKMSQVEEEYWKTQEIKDKNQHATGPILPTASNSTQNDEIRRFIATALEQQAAGTQLQP
jgi:hypothetical protein